MREGKHVHIGINTFVILRLRTCGMSDILLRKMLFTLLGGVGEVVVGVLVLALAAVSSNVTVLVALLSLPLLLGLGLTVLVSLLSVLLLGSRMGSILSLVLVFCCTSDMMC